MNEPHLQIHQTSYRLGWEVQKASYSFEPAHTSIEIEQQPAEMRVHRTNPLVLIDQTECRADMDMKHIFRRNAEFAAYGKQQVMRYIADTVAEGEQLGAIENKGNTIANLAKGKKLLPDHQFIYRNVPGNFSLRYEIVPGELDIQWTRGQIFMGVHYSPFQHHYERGKISYYTQRKNQLNIEVSGGTIDVMK
jgi:hypothetical protein